MNTNSFKNKKNYAYGVAQVGGRSQLYTIGGGQTHTLGACASGAKRTSQKAQRTNSTNSVGKCRNSLENWCRCLNKLPIPLRSVLHSISMASCLVAFICKWN